MKKLVYILIAFVVFLSFTAVNLFAGEVNKAKEAEKTFVKAIAQDNGCNLSIDAQNVSDDEMASVVGEAFKTITEGVTYKGDDEYEIFIKASSGRHNNYLGMDFITETKSFGNTVYYVQYATNSATGELVATCVTTNMLIASGFVDMVISHVNKNENFPGYGIKRW